ncbi:serine/threonine-protein kinase [Amycolatopsis sp. FDAARGOS 1241]|uniref:serine/threonine-protein kinase n=1 Tax=Amycolatopsis sp. FDAARGOS 1241 TaxID=2778070 RepID=UPI00194F33FC|nr:serine/threonine-protein kinase [Amycolatopsis sp. FDAARGOS 1241]QRP44850.1 serine/threonine protein kinase [Amycolatopsis sp. FDAARGOS 1241]
MTEESRQIAGRYQLVELIGSGAMGMVWRGEDKILGRVVAVKELLMPVNQGEEKLDEAKSRAMREARIAARLQHPNAISVFNVVEYEDRPWLIMEYLPSRSLSAKLHDDGPLSVDEVIPIAVQLAGVLAAAHRAGIVHRDVKPGNVLLGEDGTVKVTDFGISRAVGDVTLTATGEISGTPAFLAPEVARGEEATFASDVFALGATLYMAVEGEPPFGTADNAIALLYRVSSGSINPPKQAGRLEPLLLKLLELKPDDRPSMAEVLTELRELDGHATPVASVPVPLTVPAPVPAAAPAAAPAATPTTPAPAPVDRRRRPMILAGAGAVVVVLVVVVIVLLTRNDSPSPTANGGAPAPVVNSSAPSTTAPPTTTNSQTPPPPSTPSSSSSAPPTPSSAANPAESMEAAVQQYFGLLPGNLDAGYSMLASSFESHGSTQSRASYDSFWGEIASVSVSDVKQVGANQVSATVHYVKKSGVRSDEHHTYTMVNENGAWKIAREGT